MPAIDLTTGCVVLTFTELLAGEASHHGTTTAVERETLYAKLEQAQPEQVARLSAEALHILQDASAALATDPHWPHPRPERLVGLHTVGSSLCLGGSDHFVLCGRFACTDGAEHDLRLCSYETGDSSDGPGGAELTVDYDLEILVCGLAAAAAQSR